MELQERSEGGCGGDDGRGRFRQRLCGARRRIEWLGLSRIAVSQLRSCRRGDCARGSRLERLWADVADVIFQIHDITRSSQHVDQNSHSRSPETSSHRYIHVSHRNIRISTATRNITIRISTGSPVNRAKTILRCSMIVVSETFTPPTNVASPTKTIETFKARLETKRHERKVDLQRRLPRHKSATAARKMRNDASYISQQRATPQTCTPDGHLLRSRVQPPEIHRCRCSCNLAIYRMCNQHVVLHRRGSRAIV